VSLTPPWDLTAALFGQLAKDLEAAYPGWRVTGYNGTGLEARYDIKAYWRAMTEAEREEKREAIVQMWRDNGWCRGEKQNDET